MSLGQVIRKYREELSLTQDRLASSAGISKPYLSNIATGKVKNPPADHVLLALEKALGIEGRQLIRMAHLARTPPDVREEHELLEAQVRELRGVIRQMLGGGRPPISAADLDQPRLGPPKPAGRISPSGAIPVVNTVSGGYPQRLADLDCLGGAGGEYVRCPDLHDPQAFAVRVVGDSMAPSYQEGDIVVISPNTPARSGDDCLVRFEPAGHTAFRRYYPDDEQTARLQPVNSGYPPRSLGRSEIGGLWPAVFRLHPIRRS